MNLNRRQWLVSLFVTTLVVLVTWLSGCKPDNGAAPATQGAMPAAAASKKMAVVVSTMNNPWFVVLANTASDRAKALGYEVQTFDSQNDPAKEAEHFDNIISSKYAAILFNCTDANGSVKNVQRAKDAGIPVFCMDREINANNVAVTQVLSDSYSGCVTLGQYFVKRLNEKGNYVELLGILADNNTKARSEGFHSVVSRYPNLKMAAQQTADFDQGRAFEVLGQIMQAHPDFDAVFCGNDQMAMGAYQALKAAGKADKVLVFGFDGSADAVQGVADGKIAATMMQYPKVMAATVAESADKYLKGDHGMPQKTMVAVDLVNKDTIEKFAGFGKKDAK